MSVRAVTGGTVVTPAGAVGADLFVRDGRIAAVEASPTSPSRAGGPARQERSPTGEALAVASARAGLRSPRDGEEVIDATGCFVIPGGVDPHCHLMEDLPGSTRAAALGGTTTVLSFTNPADGEDSLECLRRRRDEIAAADAFVDVGLHAMLYEPGRAIRDELASMKAEGASAVKVFLAYSELGIMWSPSGLFDLMTIARQVGEIVQVHCESGPLIDSLVAEAADAGRTGAAVFADTRPAAVEAEAVACALAVASLTGATCYLVHLSSAAAIEYVRLARSEFGTSVIAEVCQHHLLFDEALYRGPDPERYLVAPPLRSEAHVEALWEAVADGTVDALGSDHCQRRSTALHEISPDGTGYRYGLAGVGARLPLLLSEGLRRGISIERMVEVLCSGPARVFGHCPRKGVLAPGSDADFVVFDPNVQGVLTKGALEDGTGDSIYTGAAVRGAVRSVGLGGEIVVRDGVLTTDHGSGSFLPALR